MWNFLCVGVGGRCWPVIAPVGLVAWEKRGGGPFVIMGLVSMVSGTGKIGTGSNIGAF